jgi:hypothetical protein
MPKCSVIVINFNGKALLGPCLDSLRCQSYSDFETVVVDNGSDDGSLEYVAQQFPEVRILALNKNLGFCAANNVAITEVLTRGVKFFVLLNNDTFVAPDFLSEMLSVMERDERVAVVCPKIYFADQPSKFWYAGGDFSLWTGRPKVRGYKKKDHGELDEASEITLATGCAMLVRASAVGEVGLLDERFWAYLEDVEWSVRFLRKGYKLRFAPKAHVWHHGGASFARSGSYAQAQYLGTRNLLFIGWKHARWWQLVCWVPEFLFGQVFFYTVLRIVRKDFRACWAIYRGIGAFFKMILANPDQRDSRVVRAGKNSN